MRPPPHGTRQDPARGHPVLDIAHWESEFPLGDERFDGGRVEGPSGVARIEQARRLARAHGDLGPSVPADLFVWAEGRDPEKPWLTQLGGVPWREQGKPWPKDPDGVPLHFLGQIYFGDSHDILPCEIPGDVALIFGRWSPGWAFTDEVGVLEWSTLKLNEPLRFTDDWFSEMPFCYRGVIHRTVQYTDFRAAEPAFQTAGWKKGGWGIRSVQATSIGTHADLPQGWPFETGDGRVLIATLSSFYFRGSWPLCNIPRTHVIVRSDGTEYNPVSIPGMDFGVGDAGCIWIYRDADGSFKLDSACG